MRNFQDYISEAQKKQNLYSLSKIAQKIGISANSVSVMYKNKTLPSEETLIKIADLAGIPREEALLDLSIWSAKSDDAKKTWEKIRTLLNTAALTLALLISSQNQYITKENVNECILCQITHI
mgnify:CR=1 FL=1